MHRSSRFEDAGCLPALLAEYGRLAAQLRGADAVRVRVIHDRLSELDVVIDRHVAALGTTRL